MGGVEGFERGASSVAGTAAASDPEWARLQMRRRILEAFEERARQRGLRALVMIELSRDLGMSSRTVYKHYPSKAELVVAMIESWAERFGHLLEERLDAVEGPFDRLLVAIGSWIDFTDAIHPDFFSDLARDYPEANALYLDQLRRQHQLGRQLLEPHLRPGLDADLAFGHLASSIAYASDPGFCERLGVTRVQATIQVVRVWARGSLRESALGG